MAWGSGCTAYKTSVSTTWLTRYGNWTGSGFVTYADGTQAKGLYAYQSLTATSYLKTGMSASNADTYAPAATGGNIIQNIQRRRVDESGQWHVSWDDVEISVWTAGRFPGDTDIPVEPTP